MECRHERQPKHRKAEAHAQGVFRLRPCSRTTSQPTRDRPHEPGRSGGPASQSSAVLARASPQLRLGRLGPVPVGSAGGRSLSGRGGRWRLRTHDHGMRNARMPASEATARAGRPLPGVFVFRVHPERPPSPDAGRPQADRPVPASLVAGDPEPGGGPAHLRGGRGKSTPSREPRRGSDPTQETTSFVGFVVGDLVSGAPLPPESAGLSRRV